jgi:hypothetical protein
VTRTAAGLLRHDHRRHPQGRELLEDERIGFLTATDPEGEAKATGQRIDAGESERVDL